MVKRFRQLNYSEGTAKLNRRYGTDKLTYFSSKSGVLEFIAPNKAT